MSNTGADMSGERSDSPFTLPSFGAKKLLLVGTGGIGVAFMPYWINWLRMAYPDLETKIVLSRSAEQFVARGALTPLVRSEVFVDKWPDKPGTDVHHVDFSKWADVIIVYPATFSFISRLALGIGDTPVTLAMHCTRAPIGLAPGLPPGGLESRAYQRHLGALKEMENVVVVPPHPGRSVATGRIEAWAAAPLSAVIEAVEPLRAALAGTASPEEN